jgi:hypothetical protein
MESSSLPGRIQISDATRDLLSEAEQSLWSCREQLEVKVGWWVTMLVVAVFLSFFMLQGQD